MVFYNPAKAPELACNECGCRWFDRMTQCCYECGAAISREDIAEYEVALKKFYEETGIKP